LEGQKPGTTYLRGRPGGIRSRRNQNQPPGKNRIVLTASVPSRLNFHDSKLSGEVADGKTKKSVIEKKGGAVVLREKATFPKPKQGARFTFLSGKLEMGKVRGEKGSKALRTKGEKTPNNKTSREANPQQIHERDKPCCNFWKLPLLTGFECARGDAGGTQRHVKPRTRRKPHGED